MSCITDDWNKRNRELAVRAQEASIITARCRVEAEDWFRAMRAAGRLVGRCIVELPDPTKYWDVRTQQYLPKENPE